MDPQTHLIYLLLDSNLPTGGFVASSGLESWAKHGFLSSQTGYDDPSTSTSANKAGPSRNYGPGSGSGSGPGPTISSKRVTEFLDAEVENYARSTGVYVRKGWKIVNDLLEGRCVKCGRTRRKMNTSSKLEAENIEPALQEILDLDKIHESTLLSHVSRRASKAQGVAILTLYTKGLSRPPGYEDCIEADDGGDGDDERRRRRSGRDREDIAAGVVEGYKKLIRRNIAPGHLAVCWGVMTAALGLSLDKSYHLYLFLHTRSLLSAAVRLNLIGPYLSSQILLHPSNPIIDRHMATSVMDDDDDWPNLGKGSKCDCGDINGSGIVSEHSGMIVGDTTETEDDFWEWTVEAEKGPATTWPLGEVLIARHDLQHSRIFNS